MEMQSFYGMKMKYGREAEVLRSESKKDSPGMVFPSGITSPSPMSTFHSS